MKPERFMLLVALPLVAIVTIVALVLTHSRGSDAEADSGDQASWTFIAYVMGDTNLEPYALDDLTEMASVGSSKELNIVTMVDRSPDYSSEGVLNLDDWEDTKVFEVQQDEFVELDDLGELNTGDPATLASFIETAVAEYPADNYALLLWDHGGGWLGMGADETNDEDALELDEISQGIGEGLSAAGVEKLDLLGFDACLMATYEVVSSLAPYADYMVASEEVEPGHGWNYEELAVIQDDPSTDAPTLAAAMLEGFQEQAVEEDTVSDITLGILDLGAVDALVAAMDDVAADFVADPAAYTPDLALAQHDVLEFGRDPDPSQSFYQIDLGGFLDNLVADGEGELAESAAAAREALDAMVLDHIEGDAMSASTGLSIYFPPLRSWFYDGYMRLEDVPAWPAALAEFYASGQTLGASGQATFDDGALPVATTGDEGLSVFAPLVDGSSDSVVEATVAVGFEWEGESVYAMQMPAYVAEQDGRTGVQADSDLTYMTIGDGTESELVYQSIGIDPGTGNTVIDIPLDYVAPGDDPDDYEDALLSIVIDEDGEIIEEDFYARDAGGTLGAFQPDPDGTLYPIALVSTDDGEWVYQRTGEEGVSADLESLEYAIEPVPAGTRLLLDLIVRDYSGAGDDVEVWVDIE